MENSSYTFDGRDFSDIHDAFAVGIVGPDELFDDQLAELDDHSEDTIYQSTRLSLETSRSIERMLDYTRRHPLTNDEVRERAAIIQELGFTGGANHADRQYPPESQVMQSEIVGAYLPAVHWFTRESMGFWMDEQRRGIEVHGSLDRFRGASLDYDDRVGELCVELIHSARSYSPDSAMKFLSYLTRRMEFTAGSDFGEFDTTLKVPQNDRIVLSSWAAFSELEDTAVVDPSESSIDRLSYRSGVPVFDTPLMQRAILSRDRFRLEDIDEYSQAQALDWQMAEADEAEEWVSMADTLADVDGLHYVDNMLQDTVFMEAADDILSSIPPFKQERLEAYFGIDDGLHKTYEQVGARHGVTAAAARGVIVRTCVDIAGRIGSPNPNVSEPIAELKSQTRDAVIGSIPHTDIVNRTPRLPEGFIETQGLRPSMRFGDAAFRWPGSPRPKKFVYQEDWT